MLVVVLVGGIGGICGVGRSVNADANVGVLVLLVLLVVRSRLSFILPGEQERGEEVTRPRVPVAR